MTSDVAPTRRCGRAGNASSYSTSSFVVRQPTRPQGYSDQLQHKFQNRADTFAFIYATTSLYRYGTVTRDGCRAAVYKDHEPQLVSATWGVWQVRTVVQMKSTPHWQKWQTQFSFCAKKREKQKQARDNYMYISREYINLINMLIRVTQSITLWVRTVHDKCVLVCVSACVSYSFAKIKPRCDQHLRPTHPNTPCHDHTPTANRIHKLFCSVL